MASPLSGGRPPKPPKPWETHHSLLAFISLVIVARRSKEVKYWEIIADNLSKAGWSWGCVSAIDSNGRTIWIAEFDVAN
jgi:hypothetical protein